jgi:hypothetical protein
MPGKYWRMSEEIVASLVRVPETLPYVQGGHAERALLVTGGVIDVAPGVATVAWEK